MISRGWLLGLALSITATATVGCGAPDFAEPDPLSPKFKSEEKKSGAKEKGTTTTEDRNAPDETQPAPDEPSGPTTPTTPATPRTWRGHIDQTKSVRFGGDPYCLYDVVLSGIDVTLTFDEAGKVKSSSITTTMTETTPECAAAPYGVKQNAYAYVPHGGGTPGNSIILAGDASNLPTGDVTLTFEPAAASNPTQMASQLTFQRSGGAAPSLNWTLKTNAPLSAEDPL